MPKMVVALGRMNPDIGSTPGDHLWVAQECFLTPGGYESLPARNQLGSTFGPGQPCQGAVCWNGAGTQRIYAAFTTSLYEVSVFGTSSQDVTGDALTNSTNGVTFASYGEFCFASNGVDPIQQIRVPAALSATTNFADMTYTTGGAKIAPKYICSHKNHLMGANVTMLESFEEIDTGTSAVGAAFTNQPAGDSVELVSSDNSGSETQNVTIYGTRVGQGDTVYGATKALTGTTFGTFPSYSDWDKILAVYIDQSGTDTLGTVTIREASGNATIVTLAPGATSAGVQNIPVSPGGNVIDIVASAATTAQLGLQGLGLDSVSTVFDSQALSGTTTVQSNIVFDGASINIYTGNLENTITVTITSHAFPANTTHPYSLWISGTDDPEGFGSPLSTPTIVGVERLQLFDGEGIVSGIIDGGDAFYVFKTGSVYRVDGPPFIPTVISHTVGMPVGCVPYRQGRKIWFWNDDGLCFIDMDTNQITNVFENTFLRSATDYSSATGSSYIVGTYPYAAPADTTTSTKKLVISAYPRITGDSRYGWVAVTHVTSQGPGMIVYQSREEAFFVVGAAFGSDMVPVEVKNGEFGFSQPFPGSAFRFIVDGGATNNLESFQILGYSETGRGSTEHMYVLTPFIEKGPDEPGVKVTRIRPRVANMYADAYLQLEANVGAGAFILTKFTHEQNWTVCTSSFADGYSSDGWLEFSGVPYGVAFAIGISPAHLNDPVVAGALPGWFTAIDVEYKLGPVNTA